MSTSQRKRPGASPAETSAAPRSAESPGAAQPPPPHESPRELGGVQGPEPTRFGDWEKNGRCIDF
jgi:hypothetical protein